MHEDLSDLSIGTLILWNSNGFGQDVWHEADRPPKDERHLFFQARRFRLGAKWADIFAIVGKTWLTLARERED